VQAELRRSFTGVAAGGEQSVRDDMADHLAGDRLLASRILAGDDEASMRSFVAKPPAVVVRIAGEYFRHGDVIDDMRAGGCSLKAYGAMPGTEARSPLGHWLSRITVNAC